MLEKYKVLYEEGEIIKLCLRNKDDSKIVFKNGIVKMVSRKIGNELSRYINN